jgi:acetyltransferase-like isoleucine patch superfamily enzyme
MFKLAKLIYKALIFLFKELYIFRLRYLNFIILNIRAKYQNRLTYKTIPICNQRTFITGPGKVEIGCKCVFGYKLGGFYRYGSIECQSRDRNAIIKIGDYVSTNNNVFICANNFIEIKDQTRIGQNVTIMDFEAHGIEPSKRNQLGDVGNVKIGENVWIGNNVTILKNSEIGKNSIVAAGAVVSGKFPENVIIGGVPAKIIKSI